MDKADALADELARHERALRRRAGARVAGCSDPTLADLLTAIGDRRARRTGERPRSTGPTPGRRSEVDTGAGDAGAGAGRILAVVPYGPTVRVLRIERPSGFAFEAGQHVKAGAPGRGRATFSIASAPHDPHLDLAVERREGGRVTPALFTLRTGDRVDLADRAKGRLRLDARATHHLMVATVTGIAPLRSMLHDALHRGTNATFTVLLGASHAVELPFHDELAALAASTRAVTYVPTVSRPGAPANRSWRGATGRVDVLAREIAATLDPATTHVYAVGNAGMVASVRGDLGGAGFAVSTESYGG